MEIDEFASPASFISRMYLTQPNIFVVVACGGYCGNFIVFYRNNIVKPTQVIEALKNIRRRGRFGSKTF